jgi:hypothetical protein
VFEHPNIFNTRTRNPKKYSDAKPWLKVSDVNNLIVPVSENNEMKYYVHNEELFDVIHKVHLSIGHGGRNRMEHEVSTKYKNIIRDMIMLYLNS